MTAARIGLSALALALLLLVLMWAIPTVTGPLEVECGELEPAVCEAVWREVVRDMGDWGPIAALPVTKAEVSGATMEEPKCGTFTIERFWVFARVLTNDCS